MTLFPKVKKQRNNTDDASVVDAAGIDLLGDLAPLAKLVGPIHERAAEHVKYLDALGKARFQLRHQENAPPPDMKLAIQRETVAATGDAAALARFDLENAEAFKAEAAAREKHLRDKELLPARIAALEAIVQESAYKTSSDLPVDALHEEAMKLFAPYADQLLAAARVYAQVRREAMTVAHVLTRTLTLHQYDPVGQYRKVSTPDLTDPMKQAEVVPQRMAEIDLDTLVDINYDANHFDQALVGQLESRFRAAGIAGDNLTIYRPKGQGDERKVYAPEPAAPAKRPEASPYATATRVVINTP